MHYSNQNKIYKSLDLTLAPEMIRKQFQTLIGPAKRGGKLVNIIKKTEALAFYGPNMETGFNFNIPGIL